MAAWQDEFNQKFNPSLKGTLAKETPSTTGSGSWQAAFNDKYKQQSFQLSVPKSFSQPQDWSLSKTPDQKGVEVKISDNAPWWKRSIAAGANSLLGSMTGTAQALADTFKDSSDLSTLKDTSKTASQRSWEDTRDLFGRILTAGSRAFNLITAAPSMAAASAVAEIPVLGAPVKVGLKGLGWISDETFNGIKSTIAVLPIDQATKDVLTIPIAETLSTLATVAILKGGERIPGFAIEKAPIPKGIKAPLKTAVETAVSYSLDPARTAVSLVRGITKNVARRQKLGQTITPEIAKTIVNQEVKQVPLGRDSGELIVPTTEGEMKVRTDQRMVLKNLIKNKEDLDYQIVPSLGNDTNGNPVAARFEWDFKRQKGTILTTKKTTAVNLAHEIGHYFDYKLGQEVGQRLSDVLPTYEKNSQQINQMLANLALDNLGGNATSEQINQEVMRIAGDLNSEIKVVAEKEIRQAQSEQFATAFGRILNEPKARENSPTLTRLAEFTAGAETMKQPTAPTSFKTPTPKTIMKKGGVTVDIGGKQPTEGFAYSPSKETEFVTSRDEFTKDGLTLLENYKTKNADNLKGNHLGVWVDGDKVYLDVIKVELDEQKAVKGGLTSQQIALYDIKNGVVKNLSDYEEIGGNYQHRGQNAGGTAPEGVGGIGGEQGATKGVEVPPEKQAEFDAFPRDKTLSPADSAIQEASIAKYLNDPESVSQEFAGKRVRGEVGVGARVEESGKIATTGLTTKKGISGRLSYNPEKINTSKDVEELLKATAAASSEFKGQRLSKTNEDLMALSRQVNLSPEELLNVMPGSIANSESVLKARTVVADLAQELRDEMRAVDTATASPKELQGIREKFLRLQGVMKTVAGFRTEASHLFRQFSIEARAGENDIFREMLAELKKADIASGDDIELFAKKTKELSEPTTADKLWHLWYASILSGYSTHIKNFTGNFFHLLSEGVRITTTNPKELPSAIRGIYLGLGEGYKKAKGILKEGEISKFHERGMKPVVFNGKASFLNYADYVGRFLSATDAIFRSAGKGMETYGRAYDQAKKEGYSGDALSDRTEEIVSKPSEEMQAAVERFGERMTFTQKPEGILGAIAEGINAITRKVPAAKLVVPFTRVVANVTNIGLDWSPVGFYRRFLPEGIGSLGKMKKIFGDIESKTETKDAREKRQQLARATLGTAAMAAFTAMATSGNLSGAGPKETKERDALYATGWRPNSIKIGNTWYPYTNLGPLAVPMALASNFVETKKYGDMNNEGLLARATAGTLHSVSSLLDASFLSGVQDLFTALSDPDRAGTYFQRFVASTVTSPIPNLLKQTAKIFDSKLYDTKTVLGYIQSNLHVNFGGLKPKINVWGEELTSDILTQLQPHKELDDPTKKFLIDHNVFITIPGTTTKLSTRDGKRQMTEDEYYQYMKISGQRIYQELQRRLPYMIRIKDDEVLAKYVQDVIDKQRERVKGELAKAEK